MVVRCVGASQLRLVAAPLVARALAPERCLPAQPGAVWHYSL